MAGDSSGVVLPDPTRDLHWNEYRGAIHDIFADNAQAHPDRVCVVETRSSRTPERVFTYKQINESSNQLAHHFLVHGCRVGDVVMIYAHRGVDLVVAYMGALKAGATVSVLDPLYPADRQKVLLDVAQPTFLVQIRRATEEASKLHESVDEFIKTNLKIRAEIPSLELCDDGELKGGNVDGKDCLEPQLSLKTTRPGVLVGPDSAPTLSFTSGSEGRPKAVLGRHFSLTYYFPWMSQRFGLSKDDRFTMLSGIAHDPIQRDIFTPLFFGAQIVVPHRDHIAHQLLAEWMKEHKTTVTHLTPAMGQILVGGADAQFPGLHHAFFVGDLLTKKDCRKLQDLAPNAHIVNMYGTTETQRAVSYYEIPGKAQDAAALDALPDIIPVGRGMVDVQLLVVNRDDKSQICDIGEQGELFLRAGGLAEGYLGDDEKTAELNRSKFIPNWFVDPQQWQQEYQQITSANSQGWMKLYKGPRDRLYKTGDLGRFRPDGTVECTGRIDNQVKIRGFRIELGEIDTHLSHHPFIRENVTLVRRDKHEEPTLVSYIVPEARRWFQYLEEEGLPVPSGPDESMVAMLKKFKSLSEDCKSFLKGKLAEYAIPTMFIPLARMPLNPNGKVDKPALPFPNAADLAFLTRRASQVYHAMTDTQKKVAAIWAQVIPDRIARMFTPESNFFEEGGHSILAQQMFFKVRQEWQAIDIPLSVIFQSQTLEAFAAEIDRAQDPIGLRLDAMPIPGGLARAEDEAYAADARELAQQLPKTIPSAKTKTATMITTAAPPQLTVLLTGATGFLGSYILHELLNQPNIRVIAHVRAVDPVSGLARLQSIAEAYGLFSASWSSRLRVIAGDISKPRLGLSQADWELVAAEADVLIHNGAQVNWMLPYSSLRAANVLSTLDCIALCCAGPRPKKLAFVSSTSVLDCAHYVEMARSRPQGVPESDDLEGSAKGLGTGYGQSKWASEFLVREAGRRGLVGSVVRPGYVVGDPGSGISVTDDFLVRLWKGCLQVNARPDIANTLNQVPVTQVSRTVLAAALHPEVTCVGAATAVEEGTEKVGEVGKVGVVQITAHPRLTLNEWMGSLEEFGYRVPCVGYKEWTGKLLGYVEDSYSPSSPPTSGAAVEDQKQENGTGKQKEEHALFPLFHFVTGNLPHESVAPELDDANATAVLRAQYGSEDGDRAVGKDAIAAYVAFLVASGFMPAPPVGGETERKVPECKVSGEKIEALVRLGGRGKRKRGDNEVGGSR